MMKNRNLGQSKCIPPEKIILGYILPCRGMTVGCLTTVHTNITAISFRLLAMNLDDVVTMTNERILRRLFAMTKLLEYIQPILPASWSSVLSSFRSDNLCYLL